MPAPLHRTTKIPAARLAAAAVALGSCLALAVPAGTADAAPADPVKTVFFGDSYTANFGIAPVNNPESERGWCFQATKNYPGVATESLKGKGITLDVQADVSCGGALIHHVWQPQELLQPGSGLSVPEQEKALTEDTRLIVGSMGGNTLGFNQILKQCSTKLRGASLLPGDPVDAESPADKCAEFFTSDDGKAWLDYRFEVVEHQLGDMLNRLFYRAPDAERVLVGYPRLVPQDTTKCLKAAPGQTELPFADIPQDALPVLDKIQKRLDDVMKKAAKDEFADFVDLYDHTGGNTACDGINRGIGGLLEESQLDLFGTKIPWYAHPNEEGRDLQAQRVTAKVQEVLNR
ncbi:SGNH/GDSL hydrolase family protein [Streptomyces sp. NPDC046939]|uniref:SGNH/GDSL hydrolase family protein n=1 Tax=Streptomyces sp. NPDC046939 TaxID=3155376 RepID=UPI0033CC25E9